MRERKSPGFPDEKAPMMRRSCFSASFPWVLSASVPKPSNQKYSRACGRAPNLGDQKGYKVSPLPDKLLHRIAIRNKSKDLNEYTVKICTLTRMASS